MRTQELQSAVRKALYGALSPNWELPSLAYHEATAAALAAVERALVGVEDGDTHELGALDRYFVFQHAGVVGWVCKRDCGSQGGGTAHMIARDLDGDQTDLTLGEMVEAALRHEREDHTPT